MQSLAAEQTLHITEAQSLDLGFAPVGTIGRVSGVVEYDGSFFIELNIFREDRRRCYVPATSETAARHAYHVYNGWYVDVAMDDHGRLRLHAFNPLLSA